MMRRYMERNEFDQYQTAEALGISQSMVSRILAGKTHLAAPIQHGDSISQFGRKTQGGERRERVLKIIREDERQYQVAQERIARYEHDAILEEVHYRAATDEGKKSGIIIRDDHGHVYRTSSIQHVEDVEVLSAYRISYDRHSDAIITEHVEVT